METLEGVAELIRRGQLSEAALACENRLAVDRHDLETLSMLAEIKLATAQHEHAAALLAQIVALRPRDAAALRRLAGALLARGRAQDAADALRRAIVLDPTSARAYSNLGQALMQLGARTQAIGCYQAALQLEPGYAIAHNNLGLAHSADGNWDPAIACFRRAIDADPALAIAQFNLAVALDKLDHQGDALQAYERALGVDPCHAAAWLGRGAILARQDRWTLALECFDKAATLQPDAAALVHKAWLLLAMGRSAEALIAADAALMIDESSSHAHNVRAASLRRLGRHVEALESLERALALDPTFAEAWGNQAIVLHEIGEFERAVAACRKAIELEPDGIRGRTQLLARLIPSVPQSEADIRRARDAFDLNFAEFRTWMQGVTLSRQDALALAQQQFFYLAYEEQSNRSLLQDYRSVSAARLAAVADLPSRASFVRTGAGRRLKIGFASAHVYDHSVFNAILRGWLQHLDRDRFDVRLFSVGTRQDALTQAARESADYFDGAARPIMEWARLIHGHDLDALIYPEIGMNETTLALASCRLARRQLVAWGHPETSGLPTIDGYLSGELFEPAHAQDHYSEPLVRLPNLGVYCEPYGVAPDRLDLSSLGIAGDRPVLICPGVPFKYRPQHDAVLAEIARRLGRCTLVFFECEIASLSHELLRRIAARFEHADLDSRNHLRLIPWQSRSAFFGLLHQADVYLDTIGFSGFNTLMQAIECRLPCVTYEGRFMRGRLGAGILKRLRLDRFIAGDLHQYVDLAVALAEDAGLRARVRSEIQRAEPALYGDMSSIDALSAHLFAA
jgi:predicted O-linked N-acetylglucosamine transferase (SPINDLY family)